MTSGSRPRRRSTRTRSRTQVRPQPKRRHRHDHGSADVPLADALVELQELTERLRRDCPWDREQTGAHDRPAHRSRRPTRSPTPAIGGDDAKLLDELGDLLFQVYFLALLLEERGHGDLETVARGIHEKLVRRHPHVFGDAEARTPGRGARALGADQDRAGGREGVFHDVPGLAARAAPRAQGAAPRGRGRLRLARSRRRAGRSRGRARRARGRARARRCAGAPPETEPDPRVADEIGDVLFTRSTSRGG